MKTEFVLCELFTVVCINIRVCDVMCDSTDCVIFGFHGVADRDYSLVVFIRR
jgi:hypothetical protein